MAVLLNAVTTNTVGTGAATADSTRQLIEIPSDAVFNGAIVTIEGSSVDNAAKYSGIDRIATLTSAGNGPIIELPIGHFVRAVLTNAGSATNVTVNMLAID